MELINTYFEDISEAQKRQFAQLGALYEDWNAKINVVSRKDIGNLYLHHVLHSLSIAKLLKFKPYTHVLDVGTGGGFPGIPLAIMFPQARFTLIDSTAKKIRVCNAVIEALGLTNIRAEHSRVQHLEVREYDFMTARGVTNIGELYNWAKRLVNPDNYNDIPNGLLALKGGDLDKELTLLGKKKYRLYAIKEYFDLSFFDEKYVVHVGVRS